VDFFLFLGDRVASPWDNVPSRVTRFTHTVKENGTGGRCPEGVWGIPWRLSLSLSKPAEKTVLQLEIPIPELYNILRVPWDEKPFLWLCGL
jgi:hypothetical protein